MRALSFTERMWDSLCKQYDQCFTLEAVTAIEGGDTPEYMGSVFSGARRL